MGTTKKRILIQKIFLFALTLLLLLTLPSCGSFDKDDVEISVNWTQYKYHPETNRTTVYCDVTITNETIYNIDSIELNLELYSNGLKMSDEVYQFQQRIKHGEFESVTITLTAEGQIDRSALVSWTPNYEPLWKTYINAIVIGGLLLLAGVFFWIWEEFF